MNQFRFGLIFTILIAFTGCGRSDEEIAKVIAGGGYLLLDTEGQKVRVPVKVMEIYLVDPDYQSQYPERFQVTGPDLHFVGTFPMSMKVGYGEHFEEMLDQNVEIAASGNPSRRRDVESFLTLPGEAKTFIEGGMFKVTKVLGDKVLQGTISLELQGSRTLSGSFVFAATTWG